MAKTKGQKQEMLNLIMEKNAQIKEMEVDLEKIVKENIRQVDLARTHQILSGKEILSYVLHASPRK